MNIAELTEFFTDPVLRGPTLGSFFQALTTSLIGVLVFLRKESLLGESLSHATYPGLILGLLLGILFSTDSGLLQLILPLVFACLSAFLALKTASFLTTRLKVKTDTALALILSSFFGFGVLLVSALQHDFGALYKKGEALLLGQAATMQDAHIGFYALLFILICLFVILLKKEIISFLFDRSFSQVLGLPIKGLEICFQLFFLVAIVAGIRSAGVVLVSSLLIAPPLIASLFTSRFYPFCLFAAFIGGLSAILGTIFSTEATAYFGSLYHERVILPTGPCIALFLSLFALLSILFAPKKGYVARRFKVLSHRFRRLEENLLKFLWRRDALGATKWEMDETFPLPFPLLSLVLLKMKRNGQVIEKNDKWFLTDSGYKKGSRVVRLHRLWELYLVDILGKGRDEVHVTAEEMEHILTPELEEHLLAILKDPELDPHKQPIPR